MIINSVGYPRSISLSVALQTLRRLSEETDGSYFETDMSYTLPASYLKHPFNNIDNGGGFSVQLDELYRDDPPDTIKLVFETGNGVKSITAPVKIKVAKNIIQEQSSVPVVQTERSNLSNSSNDTSIKIVTRQIETQPVNLWLWYGLPAAFIIIIVFILITLFLLWHRQPESKVSSKDSDYKPYAYLVRANK